MGRGVGGGWGAGQDERNSLRGCKFGQAPPENLFQEISHAINLV